MSPSYAYAFFWSFFKKSSLLVEEYFLYPNSLSHLYVISGLKMKSLDQHFLEEIIERDARLLMELPE
jgi:hypothetical protein